MNGNSVVYESAFESPQARLSASRLNVNSQSNVSVKAALAGVKLKTIQVSQMSGGANTHDFKQ
jgi:hypothetical protein